MKKVLNNETRLLCKLKAGDKNAFLSLYDAYHPALYSYVISFVKLPDLAEDVLQEVFLKIWEVRGRIDPNRSFNAYLYKISRNLVFKLMKKIAADEALTSRVMHHLYKTVEGPEVLRQWKEYENMLVNAIHQLPPQRQKIFSLCRGEGKKYEEVAKELNISRNTVKEHMVLATRFIRDYFYEHADLRLSIITIFLLNF